MSNFEDVCLCDEKVCGECAKPMTYFKYDINYDDEFPDSTMTLSRSDQHDWLLVSRMVRDEMIKKVKKNKKSKMFNLGYLLTTHEKQLGVYIIGGSKK